MNWRRHPDEQKRALRAVLTEIGFARSLLAYELPDGRLKLIDGHLRQSLDPDAEVTVEVLDVTDAEAKKLLLSIDPLAQLAGFDADRVNALRETVHSDNDALNNLWASLDQADAAAQARLTHAAGKPPRDVLPEKYLVLIECENEQEQVRLLRRFKKEGLTVQAKIS